MICLSQNRFIVVTKLQYIPNTMGNFSKISQKLQSNINYRMIISYKFKITACTVVRRILTENKVVHVNLILWTKQKDYFIQVFCKLSKVDFGILEVLRMSFFFAFHVDTLLKILLWIFNEGFHFLFRIFMEVLRSWERLKRNIINLSSGVDFSFAFCNFFLRFWVVTEKYKNITLRVIFKFIKVFIIMKFRHKIVITNKSTF